MSNREISRLFSLYAELLLLHQKDEPLAALLSGAAYRLRNIEDDITGMNRKEIAELFRPEIIGIVDEINDTQTIEALDELIQLTPQGLFEMMRIKGLGGKKLSVLWKTAKIDSMDTLLEACNKNEVSKIKGFGTKTQENIIKAIETYRSSEDYFHYASVADNANTLLKSLQSLFKTKLISLCGEIRRQSTTVKSIEIIAALSSKQLKSSALGKFLSIQSSNDNETSGRTLDEIPVTIYHTTIKQFYYELFKLTGSEKHITKVINRLKDKHQYKSEGSIYDAANLPFVVPEMREDVAEWDFKKSNDELIKLEDIKGVAHNHTTWSDGVDTLRDFVLACKKLGYEYCVISDHSKNAHYAGGLKEEKVLKQMKEIDKLNKDLAPFKIFKSIECDIRVSGDLDYENDFLKLFDLVIISIHQLLKMNEEKATARLIKAIENPYTTILGHMTGRQLLIRPGYPLSFKRVIDACAANNVVIEINANPYRLDMDWSHIPYALKKGVMISINPDAHSIAEIDNIRWGVSAARKGGLTTDMTWNAMGLTGIESWLKKCKTKRLKTSKNFQRI